MKNMLNVLIVEDDPMVALINRKYLESMEGVSVKGVVMDEKDILKALEKDDIDLILLDIYLPKKNGIDILRDLRKKGCLVDVIMITAGNSPDEVKTALAYGAADYLVKPFEFNRFEEAVKKYIERKNILQASGSLSQNELDKIRALDKNISRCELPKGLNERTLKRVLELLNCDKKRIWTVRDISTKLMLSNVTVKKYMDFLEESEKVTVDITSGNIGRPELLYKINS